MHLPDGYSDLPPGNTASCVPSLQSFEPPPRRPASTDRSWVLLHVAQPAIGWYRELFHRFGDDWLWFSRLQLSFFSIDTATPELYTLSLHDALPICLCR